jgi:hypothetical protein
MNHLFVQTLSQALQACVPVALWLAWWQVSGARQAHAAGRIGVAAAFPLTILATWLFARSTSQAQVETVLAALALAGIIGLGLTLRRSGNAPAPRRPELLLTAALMALFIARQGMEIGVMLAAAAFEIRSLPYTRAIGAAALAGAAVAMLAGWGMRRLPRDTARSAIRALAVTFGGVLLMYAVHEASEAEWLPWSEAIHNATEVYGPEGQYGRYASALLVLVPLAAAAFEALRTRIAIPLAPVSQPAMSPSVVTAIALLPLALIGVATIGSTEVPGVASTLTPMPGAGVHALLAEPHVLFRHTAGDSAYGMLSAGSLEGSNDERASAALNCERVAFAGGQGLCLQADRGIFTTYNALVLDSTLQPRATLKLDGAPSRARVSADGKMGAVTVFLAESHGYATQLVSTKTSLIDMTSGEFIGHLEEFSTWRDDKRIKEADFNFWGVTFARDGKTFYATLQTAGRPYLVRGDLALRKLTVVHPDVECPSLSPDGATIAFKRRLPGSPVEWRVYLLDVATMTERPLALETRSVDDQMEWLDSSRLLYAIPRTASPVLDVWVAPIDGSGAPTVFLAEAESPAVVRSLEGAHQ